MSLVQTPRNSRFGGLILPEETLAALVRHEVSASYASTQGDNKNTRNWSVSMGSADADSVPYMNPLRWQARDLDRNNPIASGTLDTFVDNVVATGVRPQAKINWRLLGMTEDQARAWESQADEIFYLWADSKDADVTRSVNFWEYQGLALLNTLMSGDTFTIRRFKERPSSFLGTCMQMVEADRCDTPPEKSAADARVSGGVEYDADGQTVKFHFLKEHPGDFTMKRTQNAGQYTSVAAVDEHGMDLCLHHIMQRRPEQRRGISIFAPVMEQFKQLSRYTEAEITAAVVSGMFSVFVKSESAGGSGLMPGTIPGQVGTQQITPTGTGLTKLQSGMIMDLAPGEEVQFANPNRPNTAFEPFTDAAFKHIGVGVGLPKEVMMKHFGSSYSASRAAILIAFKRFLRVRSWEVASLCQPVRSWVIAESVARGYLRAPGFFDDPMRRAAFLGAIWRGAPMGQIDPLKEANAATTWLKLPGATTVQQVAAEQFGTDYEDNLEQTKRERTQIADLPPDPLAPPPPAAAGEQPPAAGAGAIDINALAEKIAMHLQSAGD